MPHRYSSSPGRRRIDPSTDAVTPLPAGFRLTADPTTQSFGDGRVLTGGNPLRLLRFSDAGRTTAGRLLFGGDAVDHQAGPLARKLIDAGLAHPDPPKTAPAAEATVVVPVRDRPRQLRRCLTAIGKAAPVIVVDDGSEDPAAIAEVCRVSGASLIRLTESRGPSGARNAALPMVKTELIAFVDSDTIPQPGWLRVLQHHFADPAVGAVAPRIRPTRLDGGSVLERYAAARSPLDMGATPARVSPYGRVAYVPTATLVVRRGALGVGFDVELRYAEDVDLVWRMHDAGWTVRYDPSAVVLHEEPASWSRFLRRRHAYGGSSAELARRHPGRVAHLAVTAVPACVALLLLARRPAPALTLATVGAGLLGRRLRTLGLPVIAGWSLTARAVTTTLVAFGRVTTTFATPVLLAGVLRPRTRHAAASLLLALPASEFVKRKPRLNPASWTVACIADEFAYGVGVLRGCLRCRSTDPLRPRRARTISEQERARAHSTMHRHV